MSQSDGQINSAVRWFLELGPLTWVIVAVSLKTLYLSASLQTPRFVPGSIDLLLGHPAAVSASLASIILLVSFLPLLPRIARYTALLTLNLLLTLLVGADLMNSSYFGDVFSVSTLSKVQMAPAVLSSLAEVSESISAVLLLDVLVGAALLPYYVRGCRSFPPFERRFSKRLCIGLLVAGLLLALPALRVASQDENGIFAYANIQHEVVAQIGWLPYHVADVVRYLNFRDRRIQGSDRKKILRFFASRSKNRGAPSDLFGVAKGQNLILISAESLQSFPIGLNFNGQEIAPRLSAFTEESLQFVNFHDQTHHGTSADGEFTSLQSLHPLGVGIVSLYYDQNRYYGLPAILSEHGYKTLSTCGVPEWVWHMDQMHPRLGFQESFFDDRFPTAKRIDVWVTDSELFSYIAPVLEVQKQPFMAYLDTSSSHYPFRLPKEYHALKLGELEGTVVGNYLQAVRLFDQSFGELLDRLKESGLLDRSIVAVFGDHQAFLYKYPELTSLLGFPEESEYHRLLVRKKVPFLVRLPHGKGAGVRKVAGGHLDISPTLLSLLGIKRGARMMLGTDLTSAGESLVIFRDGSFTNGEFYFVNHLGTIANCDCYSAATGEKSTADRSKACATGP